MGLPCFFSAHLCPTAALPSTSLVQRGGRLSPGQQHSLPGGAEARRRSSFPELTHSGPRNWPPRPAFPLDLGWEKLSPFPLPQSQERPDVQVKPPSQGHWRERLGINPMRPSTPGQEISVEPGSLPLGEQGQRRESHRAGGGKAPHLCGTGATGPTVFRRRCGFLKLHQRKTNMRRDSSPASKISDVWFFPDGSRASPLNSHKPRKRRS